MTITFDPVRHIVRVELRRSWPTHEEYLTALAHLAALAITERTTALLDFRQAEGSASVAEKEMRLCARVLSPQLPPRRAYVTRDDAQLAAARLIEEAAADGLTIAVFRDEADALRWLTASSGETHAETHDEERAFDRRRHQRYAGPFEGVRVGVLETPLQIFDLSLGGCFVNSMHEQQEGVTFKVKIELPGEGWIPLRAETLYRRPGGYAVKFIDVDEGTRARLRRGLENATTEE
jgi:hypothetical protein